MHNKPHTRKRCGAKTRTGKPCKNGAMANGRCRMHGGKSTGPPPEKMKGNSNARTHGLFAKYLPDETLEIMNSINEIKPLDILWTNIQMQFASIIRAQQIMYVENKDDHATFKTKERSDDFADEIQIEVHASWDKQATFMNSLSRSMAELRNMLKQYVELSTHDDDRLLEIKRMQAQIDKTNAEIDAMNRENTTGAPPEITIVDAWTDEDDSD
ncbi:phage terminase small subunit [Pueribacillus sp. YX66]|uniref:phage terminase small subunit n=1 Tax=Pueribacillus sp. YX66 TaxID=3229242 RepID=UPI00358D1160